jgi:methyl-accepting chemotaxis protein
MFMDTLASVQFQDVTRQQIEQVIGGIERLDTHADALAGVLERGRRRPPRGRRRAARQADAEQVFSTYVMDQQRDAHQQAMAPRQRRKRARGPGTARQPRRRMPAAPAKSSNVELF